MKNSHFMKKICCLILCVFLMDVNAFVIKAETVPEVAHVYARFANKEEDREEIKDVLTEVFEIEGSVMSIIDFEIQLKSSESSYQYSLAQYRVTDKKFKELIKTSSSTFSINAADLEEGIPVYLCINDSIGNNLLVKELYLRVNHGRINDMVPENIVSEYKESITVKMDELLPGMKFVMHPYLIPMTARVFTDGRFVIGIGINSSNTSFWKDCLNGKIESGSSAKDLEKAFWGKSENKSAVSGGNMGLLFEFSGWVQGNMYSDEPLKGELSAFVGTGFNITGQYMILTWEVTVTGGADGVFEFQLEFNDETKKYENFQVDKAGFGVKAGLELYGGLGLSSVASIGIYGAGSVAGYSLIYPKAAQDSLVLSGECGFKVKLFSRTLFSYAIVSGSYDFVRKNNSGLLNLYEDPQQNAYLNDFLLKNSYASYRGMPISEPDTIGLWHTDGTDPEAVTTASLEGYENEKDFAHLVAENIYPDNRLQVVQTGTRNVPQMNLVFLGSDPSRENGNRSRLMNLYYLEDINYLSDPAWINPEDDGTADYDPYVYRRDNIYAEKTYLVWRNGLKEFNENSTLEEISQGSDIFFAQHHTGGYWDSISRVTEYSMDGSEYFATGAKVSEESNGQPIITYYLNRISDPAGVDYDFTHPVYVARPDAEGGWANTEIFSVKGCISELFSSSFQDEQMLAVSYEYRDGNERVFKIELRDEEGNLLFERFNASNARFIRIGYDEPILTWLEEGRLYYIAESSPEQIQALTPKDLRIPNSDYQIFSRYGSYSILLLGTVSKETSEDVFAIASMNGGNTWKKVELTDIENSALVNELGIAFTRSEEPIFFYSVQKYQNNFDASQIDNTNLLQSSKQSNSFTGLQSVMIGQNDPRFTDTQTDLYVKARKANQQVSITDATFLDEDGARKGQPTPVRLQIENTGLYDVNGVTIFADGNKIGEFPLKLAFGETAAIDLDYTVPSDCPDEPLNVTFALSSRESQVIESELDATLGTGHVAATYQHEYITAETLHFMISNNGFASKTVYAIVRDQDTGEVLLNYPIHVAPGGSSGSFYSIVKGLWRQQGHENIEVAIRLEGENIDDLDSTRFTSFKGLEEIYLQDISGMPLKKNNSSNNQGAYKAPLTGITRKRIDLLEPFLWKRCGFVKH